MAKTKTRLLHYAQSRAMINLSLGTDRQLEVSGFGFLENLTAGSMNSYTNKTIESLEKRVRVK